MDLLQYFLDSFAQNPVMFVTVPVTLYVVGKWLYKEGSSIKNEYDSRLRTYHNQENEREEKEDKLEDRLKLIEDRLDKDYVRVQKSESHLYEMANQIKDINEKFDHLNVMLTNLRLESMRGRILDFAPLAIDISHPQSKERYTEIYKVHADYMELIKETGSENGFEVYNFDLITKSYEQRAIKKMFTEDCYIIPQSSSDRNISQDMKYTKDVS